MVTGQRDEYDVVVTVGGAAGLNGALMLARARRRVLVIDAGAPRNAPAAAVHGLLGRDGMAPGELLERGRAEVRRYGGQVAIAPRMVARAGVLAPLGLHPAEHPSGAGMWVPAGPGGRTEVPGVWVAGNVTDLGAQVGAAAAAGATAGAMINADLVDEETREAVAAVPL